MTEINTDLMRQEQARKNIRIPFPKNDPMFKVTITDMKGNNRVVGEVMDISPEGAAILLNRNDIGKYEYSNMGISVTLIRTENQEKLLEDHQACVCFDPDRLRESVNGDHPLGIEFLETTNTQLQDIGSSLESYIVSPSFRQAIREKVQFNKKKKGESLYKYLDRVLHFMNNFINSDIGMVGYVVQEGDKKVITVEDTVFVGHRVDEFKDEIRQYETQKLSELNLKETNYDENQRQEYCCMAYSQVSERIYFIRYKENLKNYHNDNIMDRHDKEAAVQGKFNRIDEKIQAEITVPIKPWYRHNYDKSHRGIVENIFRILEERLKNCVDVKAFLRILNFPNKRDGIGELRDEDFVLVNDLTDEDNPRVLFRNPVSNASLSMNWDALGKIGEDDNQKMVWKSIIDDIQRKSCDENSVGQEDIKKNEVIALLNFELIEPKSDESQREHGFDKNITRKILQIIREEVEIEIAGAMFDHYNSLRMLFYHTLISYLMGEPHHAYNELGRWREVQCRNMFRNFFPLRTIFNGYREFLKQEAWFFNIDSPEISDESTYNLFLNLTAQDKTPDTRRDGHGGIGLFHTNREDRSSEFLLAIQRCYIPVVQLHFILEDIKDKLNSNEIYLKRARNIAIQIKRNIEPYKNGLERPDDASLTDYIGKFLDKLIEKDKKEIVDFLRTQKAFRKANEDDVINSFQENFYDHYFLAHRSSVEKKKKRMKYILDYFLHMRFLIGVAQLRHIIRRREPSEMTFSDFEIVDKTHREFILRFIETSSMLILSESVKSEIKGKDLPEEDRSITVPLAIAYLYRAKAFLLLGENQRAYNDFIRLERLAETRSDNFLMDPSRSPKPCFWLPKEKAKIFVNWLKVLLNYHKGRVYFVSFAKSQALVALCQSMEKLSESDKTCGKIPRIPRITTIDSMIFKGKAFFERGSYSRSLKWYFKALYEIVTYIERWRKEKKEPRQIWTPLQCALIEDLINLMEEYKHNAFIKKAGFLEAQAAKPE
ncbi:MAG: PilZ domain-containing protein, partial [Nitrospirota bacterium]